MPNHALILVVFPAAAGRPLAAVSPKPQNGHGLTGFESNHALANLFDPAGDFMDKGERRLSIRALLFRPARQS